MVLTRGVVDLLSVPQVSDLVVSTTSPVALDPTYTLNGSFTIPTPGPHAYGMVFATGAVPIAAGRSDRNGFIYQDPWLATTILYRVPSVIFLRDTTVLHHEGGGIVYFDRGEAWGFMYSALPGWEVSFAWLVAP